MIKKLGYSYLYHYNPHTNEFLCFHRDSQNTVFNGRSTGRFELSNPLLIGISNISFEEAAERMYNLIN